MGQSRVGNHVSGGCSQWREGGADQSPRYTSFRSVTRCTTIFRLASSIEYRTRNRPTRMRQSLSRPRSFRTPGGRGFLPRPSIAALIRSRRSHRARGSPFPPGPRARWQSSRAVPSRPPGLHRRPRDAGGILYLVDQGRVHHVLGGLQEFPVFLRGQQNALAPTLSVDQELRMQCQGEDPPLPSWPSRSGSRSRPVILAEWRRLSKRRWCRAWPDASLQAVRGRRGPAFGKRRRGGGLLSRRRW